METPIADFINEYAKKNMSRFHMPGHKGQAFLGCESWDITEIAGADALYEAQGIIAESEKNATKLFGAGRTVYSTEGSSQCIRAMMHLLVSYWRSRKEQEIRWESGNKDFQEQLGVRPYVLAARNVHKAFLYAAALVDFDVVWLYPEEMISLCSCKITAEQLQKELVKQISIHRGIAPAAVYVTSPDYLGETLDLCSLAAICHQNNTFLAVDNAHGSYLHFLETPLHPMDLGADICCDSAHKTLPVLTGGAYLHISKQLPVFFEQNAKQAMALFGSTSPSYLTMVSLDLCNRYLAEKFRDKTKVTIELIESMKKNLIKKGWDIKVTDPFKLTIFASGENIGMKLADDLRKQGIECEYADKEFVVFMITPQNQKKDLKNLCSVLSHIENPRNTEIQKLPLQPVRCKQKNSIREAVFLPQEFVDVKKSLGRVCGIPTVGCPPAIPIAVAGEIINQEAIRLFEQYQIDKVAVVKFVL